MKYGTVTIASAASLIARVVESALPDDLTARVNEAIAALPAGYVVVGLTLAGGGQGPTFVVEIDAGLLADTTGGFQVEAPVVTCFLASEAEALLLARLAASPSTSQVFSDTQVAGANDGTRFMGMVVTGTVAPAQSWTTYTPSFNSQNADALLGDGVIEGRFKIDGDTLFYSISLQWGTTTNGGTGFLVFGLPPSVTIDNAKMIGFGVSLSSGFAAQASVANQTFPLIQLAAADFGPPLGTVVAFGVSNSATGAFLEATSPFAFAAGDFIAIQGTVALV